MRALSQLSVLHAPFPHPLSLMQCCKIGRTKEIARLFYHIVIHLLLLLINFAVPTISPANLAVSVVSATALYLSWSSVFTPVGDVRDYTVRLLELDTGLVIDFRSTNTFITVPVHPAYSYNCSVAAVTVGRGPFSAVVSVSTPEDGN